MRTSASARFLLSIFAVFVIAWIAPASALAVDGLAPGEPVPSWAAHKFVHFMPHPSMGGLSPQLAGGHGESLHYWGGPVQVEPQLYLLFWGSNFTNGTEPKGLYTELHFFYESLSGEMQFPYTQGWQGTVTQYTNVAGKYKDARIAAESHINNIGAPKNLTDASSEAEVLEWIRELKRNGTPPNASEAQFIVLTPPGATYSEIPGCGYHSAVEYENIQYVYSVIPYSGSISNCNYLAGSEKIKDKEAQLMFSTTGVASHEFAESVTDPSLHDKLAWTAEEGNSQTEIADLCANEEEPIQELPEREGRVGWTYVYMLWDDEGGNKCKLEDPPYPTPPAPSVATEAATNLGYHQATLNGTVNPNGPEAHYHFEWGLNTASEHQTSEASAGYGEATVHEGSTITGLKPGTTYHFRISASSWVGNATSTEATFTTPIPPPAVTAEGASEVGDTHATLSASVNPEEFSTTYQFEYWPVGKASEVSKVPVSPESVGAGGSYVKVSQKLTGLSKYTEYAYRAVATNAGGTTDGAEASFVTGPFMETISTPNPSGTKGSYAEGVACSSASACLLVGYYKSSSEVETALGEKWNGIEWSLQSVPEPTGAKGARLQSVACSSSTACTAVGLYTNSSGLNVPLAERWNGTEWAVQTIPGPSGSQGGGLYGVSCASATSCIAVGFYENTGGTLLTLAESWNGTEWVITNTVNEAGAINVLSDVSCTAASACTAVGSLYAGQLIERWNGSEWRVQAGAKAKEASAEGLNAVSCVSSTVCEAAGSAHGPSALLENWNASAWSLQTAPTPFGAKEDVLAGLSCTSSTACTAIGTNTTSNTNPLAEGWNGTEWKVHVTTIPTGAKSTELEQIACPSAGVCVGVGRYTNSAGVVVSLAEMIGSAGISKTEATGISPTGATMSGAVDPRGWETTYHFEYGPTVSYGTSVPVPNGAIASELAKEQVSRSITGLEPETTYHYRLVAISGAGTSYGSDHTFTTSRSWATIATPNPSGAKASYLEGVACSSSSACWSVGYYKSNSEVETALSEKWNGIEWSLQSVPEPTGAKGARLQSVACSSSTACTAVGFYTNSSGLNVPSAERWNGIEWAVQTIPGPSGSQGGGLYGVSCASATSCIAVGFYENTSGTLLTLAESWNGTEWTIKTTPNEAGSINMLSGVSCTSATACTAVGTVYGGELVERWNGTEWKIQTGVKAKEAGLEGEDLGGVSCTSATACEAGGSSHAASPLLQSWNGSAWSLQTAPSPSGAKEDYLSGLTCFSSTACTTIGTTVNSAGVKSPLAEGWNGTEWTVQVTPGAAGANAGELSAVACTAGNVCAAVGNYVNSAGTTVTLAEITGAPVANTEAATSVEAGAATLNGTVNPSGWATTYHFEYGTTTSYGTSVPVPDAKLGSETSAEKTSRAISGLQAETTYHYRLVATNRLGTVNGEDHTFTTAAEAWTIASTPNPSGAKASYLESVACSSSTACWSVGYYKNSSEVETALGEKWNGTEWAIQSMPTPTGARGARLQSVSCSSSSACTAIGLYTNSSSVNVVLVERWNGTEWTIQSAPAPSGAQASDLYGVSCASATACTAVGFYENSGGSLVSLAESWNGSEWTIKTTPNEPGFENILNSVSCTSASACTAVGTVYHGQLIERWNGTEWKIQTGVTGEDLTGVSCTTATACEAAGSANVVSPLVQNWNGSVWSLQTAPAPSGAKEDNLAGLTCASSTACTTVGTSVNSSGTKTPLAERWNGTAWTIQITPSPSGAKSAELQGVACAAANTCFAVGGYVNSSGTPLTFALATG